MDDIMVTIIYIEARPSQYEFLESIPLYYRPKPKSLPKNFVMYAGEGVDVRQIQPDERKIPRLYYRGEFRNDAMILTQQGFHKKLALDFKSGDIGAAHETMNEIMTDVFDEARLRISKTMERLLLFTLL